MALGDTYVTLTEFKAYANIKAAGEDDMAQAAIDSASREVENHCNRQFNLAPAPTARTYEVDTSGLLIEVDVDDFATDVGLIVKHGNPGSLTTLDPSAYRLRPTNGIENGVSGWPYRTIRIPGGYWVAEDQVFEVTARWGWSAVPAPVKQATLILAAANYKRREAPLGIAGFNQYGPVRVRESMQASSYLCEYVRHKLLVG